MSDRRVPGFENRMSARDKIKPLPELATALAGLRGQERKVVHYHGVFDLLHVGHLRYFEEAKGMGDVLGRGP